MSLFPTLVHVRMPSIPKRPLKVLASVVSERCMRMLGRRSLRLETFASGIGRVCLAQFFFVDALDGLRLLIFWLI